jgi:signal transduction histidine kinase
VLAWTNGLDLYRKITVALVIFCGTALVAWVLGDSMRCRRAYYAALEERAARLEREADAQAQIATAAERARAAGMSVSLTQQGAPHLLADGAELAAYRVVQESLTNTRKHAGLLADRRGRCSSARRRLDRPDPGPRGGR